MILEDDVDTPPVGRTQVEQMALDAMVYEVFLWYSSLLVLRHRRPQQMRVEDGSKTEKLGMVEMLEMFETHATGLVIPAPAGVELAFAHALYVVVGEVVAVVVVADADVVGVMTALQR